MKIREINQHNFFSIILIILLFTFDISSFIIAYISSMHLLNVGSIINYPLLIVFGILTLFYLFGRYNPSSLQSRSKEFKIISSLTLICTFIYLVYKIGFKIITIQQSQNIILLSFLFLITNILLRISTRTIQKQLLKLNIGLRNTIIIGIGDDTCKFYKKITKNVYSGYNILGCYDVSNTRSIKKICNVSNESIHDNITNIVDLNEFIRKNNIKEVIMAFYKKDNNLLLKIVSDLKNANVCIKIVPDIYDVLTGYAKMHSVTGMPLIDINPNILTEIQIILKRFIDIFVSIIGLIIMTFPFILISILIKITSKGKVIYKQKRIGLNSSEFTVHKFRTMFIDSEVKTGPVWASKNDPRVTPLGKILRKTRLDEFPQLYDVLIGNMSIVGPRPERKFFVDQLVEKFPYYKRRLNVRPGITGWAQVMGDYDTSIDNVRNKLKLDFYYIENISIWLDIKIMILTFWIMIKSKAH